MPNIRPSADLRNSYAEISDFCHKHSEPVFITKNGKGDLAVMSMETYDKLCGKYELYNKIEKAFNDVRSEAVEDFDTVMAEIKEAIK